MVNLLVIADDFTGALDTGVQFKANGSLIQLWTGEQENLFSALHSGIQVLILDAETRHMSPGQAYQTVCHIVSLAVEAGVPCIYKKTDSGLRGNIGSELTAMLHTPPGSTLFPPFPCWIGSPARASTTSAAVP